MKPAGHADSGNRENFPVTAADNFMTKEDATLREALKHCSTTTYLAAREFRKTGGVEHLAPIIHGVIDRYVQRDQRWKLRKADGALRLVEDLAIDSLTLIEIVTLAEEVFQISVGHEELRELRTLDDLERFVATKLRAGPGSDPLHSDHGEILPTS